MKTFRRTKNTFIYFLIPFFLLLIACFATRKKEDFINWSAFLNSFLNPLSIILVILTAISLFKVGKVFNGIRLYKKFVNFIDVSKYMIVFDGCPGTGKTSSTSEYCTVLATLSWDKICYEYWLLRNTKKKWQGNKKAELDYIDNKDGFEFWSKDKNYFPCLYSNIDNYDLNNTIDSGMTVGKQKVRFFTKEMLNQDEPIPYGSVIHLEEIGDWIGNEWSQNKVAVEGVSKNSRYCRHYGFFFVINDQDCENIFINIRRSVAQNQLLLKQKWACKPRFLLGLQGFLKWFVGFRKYKDKPRLASFMLKLDKKIKTIGFRKYWSVIGGNTQTGAGDTNGNFVYCIPSTLLASYDDRYKRTRYLPRLIKSKT